MSFDQELLEAMPDTVQWRRYLGDDDDGNETWASVPTPLRANVSITTSIGTIGGQEGVQGYETTVSGTIIVAGGRVKPRDKLSFLGLTKFVSSVQTFRDAPEQGDYVQQITYDEE